MCSGCHVTILFIAGKISDPLPSDIDVVVPVTIGRLNEFVALLAPYWDRIGHGIGVTNVKQLRPRQEDEARKMTLVFESWVEGRPKWNTLLHVLEHTVKLTAATLKIKACLIAGKWVHLCMSVCSTSIWS